jgi:hypothetical protein
VFGVVGNHSPAEEETVTQRRIGEAGDATAGKSLIRQADCISDRHAQQRANDSICDRIAGGRDGRGHEH